MRDGGGRDGGRGEKKQQHHLDSTSRVQKAVALRPKSLQQILLGELLVLCSP